jgi:hypothetical protein
MVAAKKPTAASRAKAGAAKPKPRATRARAASKAIDTAAQEAQAPTSNITSLLRNLSEIAYNNQAMLANIVTNQAILLRTIESQNLNQARMTELIASTLKITESDSRLQQGAMASLETTVKANLEHPVGKLDEIGSQLGDVIKALHDLAEITKTNAEALHKMVVRFG